MAYAGQFSRDNGITYEMATMYATGSDLEVSIFVSDSIDMEVLKECKIETKTYFRFDIILNLLSRGFA